MSATPRFEDLRDFLAAADRCGMLRVVEGAHWDLELGAIAELLNDVPDNPILLFDHIPGYPAGYRVLANHANTPRKVALARGLLPDLTRLELIAAWRDRRRSYKGIPPLTVDSGPIFENTLEGPAIDVLKFPVPRWRLLDGGRYIGTGNAVITREPDTGWVNLGTYRQSVLGPDRLTIYIEPHHHGLAMAKKHWARGQACPVAVCYGAEGAILEAASTNLPPGASEYDHAGWLRGAPVPVVEGPLTGLPIPARAEIAIEGEIPPPDEESHPEGPFREWPGYYSQTSYPQPVIRVKAVYHRHDPILTGRSAQSRTMNPATIPEPAINALEAMERAGIPGIKGVWAFMQSLFIVVSIEQQYAGHAKSALAAVAGARTASSANRYYVVVDEDIDPSDINQVLWAMCTRVEPSEQVDVVRGIRTGGIDPVISPDKRAKKDFTSSIMLVDACKPFPWRDEFGKSLTYDEDFLEQVRAKWAGLLAEAARPAARR